jgi:putative sterol carrier protein
MISSSQPAQQPPSLEQIIESIPQNATPEQLKGIGAVVLIRATGDDPGDWVITIRDNTCTVERKTIESADLTLEAASDVWQKLMARKLDPGWAYMSGQMRVSGDLGLAMRLQSLLSFG